MNQVFDLTPAACRRLASAVILQATRDAQRGNSLALAWLASVGAEWADALEICHVEVVRAWSAPFHRRRVDARPKSLPEVVSTAEETMPNRLLERLGTIEGTGLEKLAVLLAERPDTTVDEAAMVLGLTRQTVKNYRHKLKASGGVIGEHNPAPAACVKG